MDGTSREAIESVIRQSRDDWKLLLFDEASEYETASVIKNYEGTLKSGALELKSSGCPRFAIWHWKKRIPSISCVSIRMTSSKRMLSSYFKNALERRPDAALAFPDYYLVDQMDALFDMKVALSSTPIITYSTSPQMVHVP